MRTVTTALALAVALLVPAAADAETATLEPVKDNTIFFSATGDKSSGAGVGFYTGKTGSGVARRGLLAFDVAGAIPAGATVTAVTLQLVCTDVPPSPQPTNVTLHRLTADWGEAGSIALDGLGGTAEEGDATWTHRFYPTTLWTNAGGDFESPARATTSVPAEGVFTWTGSALVTDVQAWLNEPSTNFGWLLLGDESKNQTARRFGSRENSTASNRPALIIEYTPPVPVERLSWGSLKSRP